MIQEATVSVMDASTAHQAIEIAAIGILGTLLGAALGAFVTWKIQARQLLHEDETRFHDRRLAIYADFNSACDLFVAAVQSGAPFVDHQNRVVAAYEQLRLVASLPVFLAASRAHSLTIQVNSTPPPGRSVVVASFNNEVAALCVEMRKELGIV